MEGVKHTILDVSLASSFSHKKTRAFRTYQDKVNCNSLAYLQQKHGPEIWLQMEKAENELP